jgi:VWFA-related protein
MGEVHMRTVFRLSAGLSLSLLALAQPSPAPTTTGQTPAATAPATAASPTDHRISLEVVVTDKAGNAVSGLTEQDFTLLDDKQPRAITSFHATDGTSPAADPALQVIFVIDAVNTGVQSVSYGRIELSKFLREDGGRLRAPTSLVIFTDKGTRIQTNPSRDGNELAGSLDSDQSGLRVLNRSAGFYGAEETRGLSLKTIDQLARYEGTQPGRKLVLWLSPGWAFLSGPNVQLTSKNEQWLFQTVVTLSRELREAGITLYSIDPLGTSDAGGFRTFYYQSFLKGVTSPRKAENGNLALQVLAVQSGGRALNSGNDIRREIAECLEDAKAFYTLSFESPPADHPDEYHDLEVKVDKAGLKARTRTGYYAEPYASAGR